MFMPSSLALRSRQQGGAFWREAVQSRRTKRGVNERTVIVEFASFEVAQAAYESKAYREALTALGDAAVRDVRIVEGVD